ncbi:MAG TPA: hypothetical protein PK082_06505 [Phycisphaerae bacterium]|nr:hypothetical protein [Phycisphaerae bacterium]
MNAKSIENDARTRHCPLLGHEVNFAYCRQAGRELPCRKVLDCWWRAFDVGAFLREQFTPEQLQAALAPPPPKLATLVDLIDRARRASAE